MKTLSIGLLFMLGGCAGLGSSDPASPHYVYSPGWTAVLERPLTIPPGAATVRLQYGQVVPRNSVQEYDPFCVVELNTVGAAPQTLEPGRFEVQRVTRHLSQYAAAPSVVAGISAGGDIAGPSFLYYFTEFRLHDPNQPNLRGMTCGWDQMAPGNRPFMRHLTLDEIHAALGDWMRLIPPNARR